MRFKKPHCPECGELLRGTVEVLHGCAEIEPNNPGDVSDPAALEFQYSGQTDVWWDGQRTCEDNRGRAQLICPNGHEWYSHYKA